MKNQNIILQAAPKQVEALAKLSWPIIILVAVALGAQCFYFLVRPALSHREWSLPKRSQLLILSGQFDPSHYDLNPYLFRASGLKTMSLYCSPFATRENVCLKSAASVTSGANLSVTFFYAKDQSGNNIPIVTSVSANGQPEVRYQDRIADLRISENVQDSPHWAQWIIAFAASLFTYGFLAWSLLFKALSQKKSLA